MRIKIIFSKKNEFIKTNLRNSFAILVLLFGTILLNAQESTLSLSNATDTLTVYKDVPNVQASDKYIIQVRSALTNGEWVNVFAHSTKNLFSILGNDGDTNTRLNYHYVKDTDGWSHTYGNIEMSRNTAVEVEISLKPGVLINKTAIVKAAAYPAHRVMKQPTIVNGKIYFTIYNPGQITIDINGQMDDYHLVSKPLGGPVHAITFFANPVIEKPSLTDPNVLVVEPGVKPSSNLGSKTTMYFKPGFHDLGINFKIFAGKKYYIPGDAVVSATLNNIGNAATTGLQSGENIKVYGYGTLSTAKIPHPDYVPDGKGGYLPDTVVDKDEHSPICLFNSVNAEINGITFSDPCFHTAKLFAGTTTKIPSTCRWVKIIGWRSNGDGLGRIELVEDTFLRTQDDASYLKGDRIRVVFWRDTHAACFHMAGAFTQPSLIDDCDVIYLRDRDGTKGAVFHSRGSGSGQILNLNLTVRNFRSSDKLGNAPFFGMAAGGTSFKGITFQNISVASNTIKQKLLGDAVTPYYGGITFDNITVKGELVTQANFSTIFTTNEYVKDMIFKNASHPITVAVNGGVGGDVSGAASVNNNKPLTVTATVAPNYKFDYWKDGRDIVSLDAIYTFDVMKARNLVAHFSLINDLKTNTSELIGNKLSIYPNPANDVLYLKANGTDISKVQMFDLVGKEVYSNNNSTANLTINLSNVAGGIYILKVLTSEGEYTSKISVKK